MVDTYRFLAENEIAYERYDHPAVFTCEEANRLRVSLPEDACKTKNLFLQNRNGHRYFLVVTVADQTIDLKALGSMLGVGKLNFASPDRLRQHLGLDRGAVTILGVMNDVQHAVEVIVDEEVWLAQTIQCHPLVNTSTLVISQAHIRRFLELTGHQAQVLSIPKKT